MRSGTNTDPVANGNRAAYAWAKADPRAVVLVAASADGQAALGRAADAFTDAGLNDKARRVTSVASMARTAGRMVALAAEITPTLTTLAPKLARILTAELIAELTGEVDPGVGRLNAELAVEVFAELNVELAEGLNAELAEGVRRALEVADVLQTTEAGGGWTALAVLMARLARPVTERRLIATTDRAESITLVRQPWNVTVATLSELEAVAVDGEPFVTAGPEAGLLAHYRARPRAAQRGLPFAGPRGIGEHLIGSPVIRALAAFPLTGDERSPIRGDTLRLAVLGYAATGPMLIDEPTGALLFGANTEANRKRFWEASRVFHHLELTDPKTGRYVTMGHAPADGRVVSLGAPFWWRGKGEGQQWSLTGRLFGPRFDSHRGSGGAAGFQSGLNRTLAGLESALTYSSPAGKGKHGRIPNLLRPTRPGGAGPDTFIPWRALLSLAGEPVPADAEPKSVWGRRYRRRVEALTEAGPSSYRVPARCGVAPAGDTVEIVRVVNGRGHGQVAGLWIRASARFCAAYQDQVKTRLPAARVFTP